MADTKLTALINTTMPAREVQGGASQLLASQQSANGKSSFSEVLRSRTDQQAPAQTPAATGQSQTADRPAAATAQSAPAKDAKTKLADHAKAADKAAQAKADATTQTDGAEDPAAQAAAAQLALQAVFAQAMPATAQSTQNSAATADSALALDPAAQSAAVAANMPAASAKLAADTASTTGDAVSTSLDDGQNRLQSLIAQQTPLSSSSASAGDNATLTGDGGESAGKALSSALLGAEDKALDTPAANTPRVQSFATELSSAQAAYGMTPAPAASSAPAAQYVVAAPVASHAWAEEVGQKLTWSASHDNGRAELVLNPPQLGKIEVSINLNGDQASASFTTHNPIARDALQDAMPRLREVLAQAGIQLGQANVNTGNSGQAQADSRSNQSNNRSWGNLSDSLASDSVTIQGAGSLRMSRGNSMIDLFA